MITVMLGARLLVLLPQYYDGYGADRTLSNSAYDDKKRRAANLLDKETLILDSIESILTSDEWLEVTSLYQVSPDTKQKLFYTADLIDLSRVSALLPNIELCELPQDRSQYSPPLVRLWNIGSIQDSNVIYIGMQFNRRVQLANSGSHMYSISCMLIYKIEDGSWQLSERALSIFDSLSTHDILYWTKESGETVSAPNYPTSILQALEKFDRQLRDSRSGVLSGN